MTGALREFLSHPEHHAKMSDAGKKRAAEFSWEKTGAAVLTEYRRLLGTKEKEGHEKTGA